MYCPTIYKECPISVHLATQCLPRDSRPPPSDIMRFRDAPSHLSASLASTAQKTSGDNPSEPLALFILHNCGPPRYILPFYQWNQVPLPATMGAAPPTSTPQGELGLQAAGKGFQACLSRDEPRDGLESGGRFRAGRRRDGASTRPLWRGRARTTGDWPATCRPSDS